MLREHLLQVDSYEILADVVEEYNQSLSVKNSPCNILWTSTSANNKLDMPNHDVNVLCFLLIQFIITIRQHVENRTTTCIQC